MNRYTRIHSCEFRGPHVGGRHALLLGALSVGVACEPGRWFACSASRRRPGAGDMIEVGTRLKRPHTSFNGKPKAAANPRGRHAVAFGLPLNEGTVSRRRSTFYDEWTTIHNSDRHRETAETVSGSTLSGGGRSSRCCSACRTQQALQEESFLRIVPPRFEYRQAKPGPAIPAQILPRLMRIARRRTLVDQQFVEIQQRMRKNDPTPKRTHLVVKRVCQRAPSSRLFDSLAQRRQFSRQLRTRGVFLHQCKTTNALSAVIVQVAPLIGPSSGTTKGRLKYHFPTGTFTDAP